jgi:hypothetical protein
MDWTGLDWTGLDWIRLDLTGLNWTGLDWTGLDWTGLPYRHLEVFLFSFHRELVFEYVFSLIILENVSLEMKYKKQMFGVSTLLDWTRLDNVDGLNWIEWTGVRGLT